MTTSSRAKAGGSCRATLKITPRILRLPLRFAENDEEFRTLNFAWDYETRMAMDNSGHHSDDEVPMPATAETQEIRNKPATPRAVFILRFSSTVVLWSVALLIAFSGFEIAFWGLISVFGLISLWEFYGMLDQRGLRNFKVAAMICGLAITRGKSISSLMLSANHFVT